MRESLAVLVCKQRAVIEDDELFSLDGGHEDGLGVIGRRIWLWAWTDNR